MTEREFNNLKPGMRLKPSKRAIKELGIHPTAMCTVLRRGDSNNYMESDCILVMGNNMTQSFTTQC